MCGYSDGGLVRYWIISLRYPDMVLFFTMDVFLFARKVCEATGMAHWTGEELELLRQGWHQLSLRIA